MLLHTLITTTRMSLLPLMLLPTLTTTSHMSLLPLMLPLALTTTNSSSMLCVSRLLLLHLLLPRIFQPPSRAPPLFSYTLLIATSDRCNTS